MGVTSLITVPRSSGTQVRLLRVGNFAGGFVCMRGQIRAEEVGLRNDIG